MFVLPQTDGGYLGPDIHTLVSAVFSGAAGVYVGTLDHDAGISTLLTVTPGQSVSVTGDPSFAPVPSGPRSCPVCNNRDAPLWGSGSFAVQERGSLALTRIALDPSASIDISGGGSLSLASMAVPAAVLGAAAKSCAMAPRGPWRVGRLVVGGMDRVYEINRNFRNEGISTKHNLSLIHI